MKQRMKQKRIIALCLAALLLAALPAISFAEGVKVAVSADKSSVSAGEEITVTVTVQGEGEKLSAAAGSFTYDPAVLTYVSGEGGVSDGGLSLLSLEAGGASSLTAAVKFTAIGEGESTVAFSFDSVLTYGSTELSGEGDETSGMTGSVTVRVTGSLPAEEGESPVDYSVSGVTARNVEGMEQPLYIWRDLSSLTLPSRYADRQIQYDGETVGAAIIADTEKPVLLYLSEASGANGAFYIYDAERDLLYPYVTVSSVLQTFAVIQPEADVEIPAGFTETVLTLKNERTVQAWTDDPDSGVYLIYVRNSADEYGFFLYNTADESVQRYREAPEIAPIAVPTPVAAPEPLPEADKNTVTLPRELALGLAAGGVLSILALLILVIVLLAREARRKKRIAEKRAAREEAQRRTMER